MITATFRRTKRFVLILADTAMLSGTFVLMAGADYKVTPGNGSGTVAHFDRPMVVVPITPLLTAPLSPPPWRIRPTSKCTRWYQHVHRRQVGHDANDDAPAARPGPSPVGATPSPGGVAVVEAVTTTRAPARTGLSAVEHRRRAGAAPRG